MIPNNQLNPLAPTGGYLYPDDLTRETNLLVDYELGGPVLNQPPDGMPVTPWSARAETDGRITLGQWPTGDRVTLLTGLPGISELSLCFDGSNRPHLAWVKNGQAYWHWFDSQTLEMVTSPLAADVRFPRLTLDDKRVLQSARRDVLLIYVRGLALYYRQQRERYATERHLADLPADLVMLGRVGMAETRRVQIEYLVPMRASSSSS